MPESPQSTTSVGGSGDETTGSGIPVVPNDGIIAPTPTTHQDASHSVPTPMMSEQVQVTPATVSSSSPVASSSSSSLTVAPQSSTSTWSSSSGEQEKPSSSKTPVSLKTDKALKRKLNFSPGGNSEDEGEKRSGTPKRRRSLLAGEGSPTPGSSTPKTPGGTQRLTERQQMALLMQMTAEEGQPAPGQAGPVPGMGGDLSPRPSSPHSSALKRTPYDKKINKRNERGETPLHVAAIRGDVKETRRLLKAGVDVNVADFAGWTAIHEACNHGWIDVAKQLLKAGANVNVQGLDNDTPLHDAAINGHKKLVELLLRHGANPLQTNTHGKSPLDVAPNETILKLLQNEIIASSSGTSSLDEVRSPTSPESNASEHDDVHSPAGLMAKKLDKDSSEAMPSLSSSSCSRFPSSLSSPGGGGGTVSSSSAASAGMGPLSLGIPPTSVGSYHHHHTTSSSSLSPRPSSSGILSGSQPMSVSPSSSSHSTSFLSSSSSLNTGLSSGISSTSSSSSSSSTTTTTTSSIFKKVHVSHHMDKSSSPRLTIKFQHIKNKDQQSKRSVSPKRSRLLQPQQAADTLQFKQYSVTVSSKNSSGAAPSSVSATASTTAASNVYDRPISPTGSSTSQESDLYDPQLEITTYGSKRAAAHHVSSSSGSSVTPSSGSSKANQNMGDVSTSKDTHGESHSTKSKTPSPLVDSSQPSSGVRGSPSEGPADSHMSSIHESGSFSSHFEDISDEDEDDRIGSGVGASERSRGAKGNSEAKPSSSLLSSTLSSTSASSSSHQQQQQQQQQQQPQHNIPSSSLSSSANVSSKHSSSSTRGDVTSSSDSKQQAHHTTSGPPSSLSASQSGSQTTSHNSPASSSTNVTGFHPVSTNNSNLRGPGSEAEPQVLSSLSSSLSINKTDKWREAAHCSSTSATGSQPSPPRDRQRNSADDGKDSPGSQHSTKSGESRVSPVSAMEIDSEKAGIGQKAEGSKERLSPKVSSSKPERAPKTDKDKPHMRPDRDNSRSPKPDKYENRWSPKPDRGENRWSPKPHKDGHSKPNLKVDVNRASPKPDRESRDSKDSRDSRDSPKSDKEGGKSSQPKVPPLKIIMPTKTTASEKDNHHQNHSKSVPYILNSTQESSEQVITSTLTQSMSAMDSVCQPSHSSSASNVADPTTSSATDKSSPQDAEMPLVTSSQDVPKGRGQASASSSSANGDKDKGTSGSAATTTTTSGGATGKGDDSGSNSEKENQGQECEREPVAPEDKESSRDSSSSKDSLNHKKDDGQVEKRVTRSAFRSQQQKQDKEGSNSGSGKDDHGSSSSSSKDKDDGKPSSGGTAAERDAIVTRSGSNGSSHSNNNSANNKQIDVSVSEETHIHPRKRKLRHRQQQLEQEQSSGPPILPPTHMEKPNNPYELFLDIRRKIATRHKQWDVVQPKAPHGFQDYLMVNCNYTLEGNTGASKLSVPVLTPPNSLAGAMKKLFEQQEKARYRLRRQHVIEKEKLMLSNEQEILRVHGRAARALANQSIPLSVCAILRDEDIYNSIDGDQEDRDKNIRSRYNGRLLLSWLRDVDDKYEKIKEHLLMRHHHEAESLYAVQKLEWEWHLKDVSQSDPHSEPAAIDTLHLPMVQVTDDFDLLPT